MKKKTKNRLLTASIIVCFGLIGLVSATRIAKPQYEESKAITYNEEDSIITLESSDISNYDLWYGLVALNDNSGYEEYDVEAEMDLQTENDYAGVYTFSGFNYEVEDSTHFNVGFTSTGGNEISFKFVNSEFSRAVVFYSVDNVNTESEISLSELDYLDIMDDGGEAELYYYLVDYYNSQNPQSQGETIIGAISSGMGLAPDLASEFLTGFTNLFWNTTSEQLTSFGTFSLVLLGIAITMAVIKLCLNIIRSNTGA